MDVTNAKEKLGYEPKYDVEAMITKRKWKSTALRNFAVSN